MVVMVVVVAGGKQDYRSRVALDSKLYPALFRVMDGFEVHIQFLDHLKRLNA